MKALSLWQPHAQAIALGMKLWETRDWGTHYRGALAIHAAQRPWNDVGPWHRDARQKMQRYVANHGAISWAFGAVICIADVVDCRPTSAVRELLTSEVLFWGDFGDGESGRGRYAWKLENVRVLPHAVSWRGQQGFFEVELGAIALARDTQTLPLFGEE